MNTGATLRSEAPGSSPTSTGRPSGTPHSLLSPTRFAARLARIRQLSCLAGVHRNTVRLNPASDALQDRLREMIKIITSASELTGDVDKALYWFRNEPIANYRGKTAADLVAEGHAPAVLTYLYDLKNGDRVTSPGSAGPRLLPLSHPQVVFPADKRGRYLRVAVASTAGRRGALPQRGGRDGLSRVRPGLHPAPARHARRLQSAGCGGSRFLDWVRSSRLVPRIGRPGTRIGSTSRASSAKCHRRGVSPTL